MTITSRIVPQTGPMEMLNLLPGALLGPILTFGAANTVIYASNLGSYFCSTLEKHGC